jgi:hypothetical protein
MDVGMEIEVFAKGMECDDDAGHTSREVQRRAQVLGQAFLGQAAEVFEQYAMAVEIGAQHPANGQDYKSATPSGVFRGATAQQSSSDSFEDVGNDKD